MLPISDYCFASCGADNLVVIWKDGRMEKLKRSFFAQRYLLKQRGGQTFKTHSSDVDTSTETSSDYGELVPTDTSEF